MGLADWVALAQGVLQFPDKLLAVVRLLQKTPQERHQDLLTAMQKEADAFRATGRPTW